MHQSSPHAPFVVALQAGVLVAFDEVEADRDRIELCLHEAVEGILRSVHDRLATNIEAGIDQHGTAGLGLDAGEPRVERRIGLSAALERGMDRGFHKIELPEPTPYNVNGSDE